MSTTGIRRGMMNWEYLQNIKYVKGDCMMVDELEDIFADVDSVVHCQGALFAAPRSRYLKPTNDDCLAARQAAYILNELAIKD